MSALYPDLGMGGLRDGDGMGGLRDGDGLEELPSPPSPLPELSEEEQMKELEASRPVYDNKLYEIQLSAPKAKPVRNLYEDDDRPSCYGDEYHGKMERAEVARVLGRENGHYIVRESVTQPGKYSLSFVFGGEIKHYIVSYRNGKHCIGEKEFLSIHSLTMDGLISLHVKKEGEAHITKCITMKRAQKRPAPARPAPPPPNQKQDEYQTVDVDDMSPAHDLTDVDGLQVPLRDNRGKLNRKTVRVTTYYKTDAEEFEKKHAFKIHTYFGFPFCDFCSNYLWGLTQQGFQCADCGINVHPLCKKEIPDDCKPNKKRITKVFGVDLTTVVKMKDIENIPPLLHKGMALVEERGLKTEGIYRVNGSYEEVSRLKDLLDKGAPASVLGKADTFVICSLLKQFLRELPMSLVTYEAYQPFIEANTCQDHDERVGMTKKAIRLLPHSHFHTLKALIEHLARVAASSQSNQMSAENLAIVFGPTIFRSPSLSADSMISDMAQQKTSVKYMIEHCWRLLR